MVTYQGRGISPGFAQGRVFLYSGATTAEVPRYGISKEDVDAEHSRFHEALNRSIADLEQVRRRVLGELGETESEIFNAHIAMLRDESFVANVKERVRRDRINIEQAVDGEIKDLARLLSEVESEYVRERSHDVHDMGRRVLRHLQGGEVPLNSLPPDSVIVAEELLPSDTLQLDRDHLVALVTERGGETTHAAILARSMGIPAVTGISDIVKAAENGLPIVVNGSDGLVILDPSETELEQLHRLKTSYNHFSNHASSHEAEESVTENGVVVELFANIAHPQEARQVGKHNLAGVGLFRTENLYLGRGNPPSLEDQKRAYRQAAKDLDGRPLVIRTLDLGGDKKPGFMLRDFEANPNIGLRGLRFSLAYRDKLFTPQIDAILATFREHSNVQILFPMVIGGADLAQAIALVEARAETLGLHDLPKIGAMVETPASLYQLDKIMEKVGFVSIGTNDLTQFMLAADRYAVGMLDEYSALHPAVLRALRELIPTARQFGRPVCACGEAAGNPQTACLFVGLGLRQLSMSPVRAARVRHAIRVLNEKEMRAIADRACDAAGAPDVLNLIRDIDLGPGS